AYQERAARHRRRGVCALECWADAVGLGAIRYTGQILRGGHVRLSCNASRRIIMPHEVTLITGDGTGPELAAAARRCVDATGVKINWDVQEAGVDVMQRLGTP